MVAVTRADFNGPFYVGNFLSAWLGGVACCLGVAYFVRFPYGKDRKAFFWLVSTLIALNCGTVLSAFWTAWQLEVLLPEDMVVWTHLPSGFAVEILLGGIGTFLVQLFYAYRVWIASGRKRLIPLVIALLSLTSFASCEMASLLPLTTSHPFVYLVENYPYMVPIWLGCSLAADLVITASTYWYIRQSHVSLGNQRSRALAKIVRKTAETNFLTFSVCLVDLITYFSVAAPWHITLNMCMPTFYVLSLLVALLSRSWMGDDDVVERRTGDVAGYATRSQPPAILAGGGPLQVMLSRAVSRVQGGVLGTPKEDARRDSLSIIVTRDEIVTTDKDEEDELPAEGPRLTGVRSSDRSGSTRRVEVWEP